MKKRIVRSFVIALILCSALILTSCDFFETAIENAVEGAVEGAIEGAVDGAVNGITGGGNEEEQEDEGFLGGLFGSDESEEPESEQGGFLADLLNALGFANDDEDGENTSFADDVPAQEQAVPEQESEAESDETDDDEEMNSDEDEEEQPEKITVNEDFKAAILGDNGAIKQIHSGFSGTVEAELFMGGTPIIYYYNSSESLLTYYQFVIDGTDLYTIWSNSTSQNDRGLPNYNLFPDTFTVDFMYHASPTMFKDVFPNAPDEIASSRNISDLHAYLGVEQEAKYTPGESNAVMTTYDKYTYTYHYDGITIMASGSEEGIIDGFVMYEIGNEPDMLIY